MALFAILFLLIELAIVVFLLAGMWKTFIKMGRKGWEGIVPFYNIYLLTVIMGKPVWWFVVILLVPIVGLVFMILLCIELAKAFGQGTGFGVGLALLPFIFFPILGFGSARYGGASGGQGFPVGPAR